MYYLLKHLFSASIQLAVMSLFIVTPRRFVYFSSFRLSNLEYHRVIHLSLFFLQCLGIVSSAACVTDSFIVPISRPHFEPHFECYSEHRMTQLRLAKSVAIML